MKPLTQPETDQLLVLLRKLWKDESPADEQVKRNAKSLFSIITTRLYESQEPKKLSPR